MNRAGGAKFRGQEGRLRRGAGWGGQGSSTDIMPDRLPTHNRESQTAVTFAPQCQTVTRPESGSSPQPSPEVFDFPSDNSDRRPPIEVGTRFELLPAWIVANVNLSQGHRTPKQ